MEFDLEYKLQEFRKEQHEIFDEDGKRYGATPISNNTGERMLQLIDELECALAKAETEIRQLTIPNVSNAERTVCPDCGDYGWIYDKTGTLRSTCPCHC